MVGGGSGGGGGTKTSAPAYQIGGFGATSGILETQPTSTGSFTQDIFWNLFSGWCGAGGNGGAASATISEVGFTGGFPGGGAGGGGSSVDTGVAGNGGVGGSGMVLVVTDLAMPLV